MPFRNSVWGLIKSWLQDNLTHLKQTGVDISPTFISEVTITNAQMLTIRATPITVVPAPGAGKTIELGGVALFFDFTAAYTAAAGDDLQVRYQNSTGALASDVIEATGFLTAAADTRTSGRPKLDSIVAKTVCENQPLVLHNVGAGEFGGGNAANLVRVRVTYSIVTTGW